MACGSLGLAGSRWRDAPAGTRRLSRSSVVQVELTCMMILVARVAVVSAFGTINEGGGCGFCLWNDRRRVHSLQSPTTHRRALPKSRRPTLMPMLLRGWALTL